MASHESPRTTKLYDRRSDVVSLERWRRWYFEWLLHMGVVPAPLCNDRSWSIPCFRIIKGSAFISILHFG